MLLRGTIEVAASAGKDEVDLVDAFAMELPRRVISKLFGFPMEQIADNDARVRANSSRMDIAILLLLSLTLTAGKIFR